MQNILNYFPDPTALNTTVGIIGIIVGLLTISAIRKNVLHFSKFILLKIFFGHFVLRNDYYSHDFVFKKISKAKNQIRIMCVRNERITEPDIIEAFRKFIVEKKGTVEIFALNPSVNDCIIEECMCVLPTPPKSTNQFRKQVADNHFDLQDFYQDLGTNEKNRFSYYEFTTLPLMHLCQFDNTLYIGFQLFYREDIDDSLLKYSIVIRTKSDLGKKILTQLTHIKNEKSEKIF